MLVLQGFDIWILTFARRLLVDLGQDTASRQQG